MTSPAVNERENASHRSHRASRSSLKRYLGWVSEVELASVSGVIDPRLEVSSSDDDESSSL